MRSVVGDLAQRWRRARAAALRVVVPDLPATADDGALIVAALDRDADAAIRGVFDVSRRLGESFRRHHRVDLPLRDVVALLPALGERCTTRVWRATGAPAAFRAAHAGCDARSQHPRACELWREAIDGLVLGLSSGVYFARHASRGAGDAVCVDALHVHPHSPARFGPIPRDLADGLAAICRTARALDGSLEIELLGVSENVLYYRARRDGAPPPDRATTSIEHGIRRRFPWLGVREVSSRAVLDPAQP